MANEHVAGPMPHTKANHLLNPLRSLILSPRRLVSRLGLRPESRVLELGPGPGYFSPKVARNIPDGKLILVDVQPEMLDMARDRLAKTGINNVEFHQGDATALPLDSESIDVAFLVAVLGEVPDREACLRELHRVLKNKGLLSMTEFKLHDPDFIPKNELTSLAQSAGFEVSAQYGGLFHYTINFVKTT
jgi:ubiquinone/menaquinone biosynthesis C-methylase UbiE